MDEEKPLWTLPFRLIYSFFRMIFKFTFGIMIFAGKTLVELSLNFLLAFDIFGIFSGVFDGEKKEK